MRELFAVYLRSAACALAAGLPLMLALASGDGADIGFAELLALTALGAGLWLAALWLTRHPAREEIRLALSGVLPMPRPQPAE